MSEFQNIPTQDWLDYCKGKQEAKSVSKQDALPSFFEQWEIYHKNMLHEALTSLSNSYERYILQIKAFNCKIVSKVFCVKHDD
jgi:hypothetical protein